MNLIKQSEASIPTPWGNFLLQTFSTDESDTMPHLAMVAEGFDPEKGPVLVRIHSECLTGDLFGSKRCDCGEQLDKSLDLVAKRSGVIIYLRQEGRGIGLINKLKAYQLQDQGMNTAEANVHLGLEIDERGYDIAINMLTQLGVNSIQLLTNNPEKIEAIEKSELKLLDRVPLVIKPQKENLAYFNTKKDLMGHLLSTGKK